MAKRMHVPIRPRDDLSRSSEKLLGSPSDEVLPRLGRNGDVSGMFLLDRDVVQTLRSAKTIFVFLQQYHSGGCVWGLARGRDWENERDQRLFVVAVDIHSRGSAHLRGRRSFRLCHSGLSRRCQVVDGRGESVCRG